MSKRNLFLIFTSFLLVALIVILILVLNLENKAKENEAIISSDLVELTDYNPEDYSIDDPYVANDIFNFNALSAYVSFPIDENASYSYVVKGKDEYTDFYFEDPTLQKDNLVIPIIGLYADYDNEVDIKVNYANGDVEDLSLEIRPGSLPEYINTKMDVDTSFSSKKLAADSLEGGFILDNRCNAYDINGDIRVALEIENLDYSGNALRINYDNSFLMGTKDYVYNLSMTGKKMFEYKTPEGYYINHDYVSGENGYTYAILTPTDENMEVNKNGFKNDGYIGVYETNVEEYPSKIIDVNKMVEDNMANSTNTFIAAQDELMHLNALDYDYATNTLMMSAQSQNAIVAIDPDEETLEWVIGEEEAIKTSPDKRLEELGDFTSVNGQHNTQITKNPKYDDGNDSTIELMVFDNRFCLDKNDEAIYVQEASKDFSDCQKQDHSRLVVYRIDTENLTVETLDVKEVEGYYSAIRSSWFVSDDYKYNYISYADLGKLVVTDDNFNVIFVFETTEGGFFQNMYRSRVLTQENLQDITHYATTY